MKNPFRYGVPVSGEFYFPRADMAKKMLTYIGSGQKVLLYGKRRFGKTSFLNECASLFKENGITTLYIDVYPITSLRDFLCALTKGIKDSRILPISQRIRDAVESVFRLRPRITVEGDGAALDFSVPSLSDEEIKASIEDTVRLFGKINENSPMTVIFDEFQKIAEIVGGDWLEGALRAEIQKQGGVPYIFCGSRRGLILDMFQNSSRPFYQMCTAIELPAVGDGFAMWLKERLHAASVKIGLNTSRALLDKVDSSPNYAQMVAFHLVADPPDGEVETNDVDCVLDTLCRSNSYTYMTLYDSLSANAQRTVRLIAMNPGKSPFSQDTAHKFGLTNSAVQSAIKSLVNKHVFDDTTSGGNVVFDDPLFLRWIQKSFSY